MKTRPGSPVCQAAFTMRSKTSRALRRPATSWVCGSRNSYSPFFARASMKGSVIDTEILKLLMPPSSLQWMNSRMSG